MQVLSLSKSEKRSRALAAAMLLAITLICYLPALRGGFIWDDDRHVAENRTLLNPTGLKRIWTDHRYTPQYYPLTHTSFWLEYRLWGLNPSGYHTTNVLLHAVNAILVWLLLRRLDVPGALLAALLFAVHPIQVESVAWISERKNLLATFFVLLSMLAYLRFHFTGYLLAFLCFAAAMFSKTIACSMPAVMVLILWWKRKLTLKEIVLLAPFFVGGIAYGLATARIEVEHVGASGAEWQLTLAQRFVIAARAICFYAGKLLWPANLTFSYEKWEINVADPWQWLPLAMIVTVISMLFAQRDRIGRGPVVAVLIFLGTLFPALGFFNTYPMRYSYVADHFVYLSSIAFLALAACGIVWGLDRVLRQTESVAVATTMPIIALLGILTFMQSRIYRDSETLWRDTMRKNPSSWMARNNLGAILSAQADADRAAGRSEAADRKLEQAVSLFREVEDLHDRHDKARLNRAEALLKLRRFDEAMQIYEAELHRDPNNARLITQIGITLLQMNRLDLAEQKFRQAIPCDPSLLEPRFRLAKLYEQREWFEHAIEVYRQLLEAKPDVPQAHLEIALLLYRPQINRLEEAANHLERYLELSPHDAGAHATLGFVYGELGRYGQARERFAEALRLDPNEPAARRGMNLMSRRAPATQPRER